MMMPNVDIAARVYNHRWKIDPIVRSLLDTDFYKLLMCQSVFRNKRDTNVTFQLINRTKSVRVAEVVDEVELREQLDQVRALRLTRGESTWLRGNTFYGKRQMFRPDFMEWLENVQLPDYELSTRDGQYELRFEGKWPEVMLCSSSNASKAWACGPKACAAPRAAGPRGSSASTPHWRA